MVGHLFNNMALVSPSSFLQAWDWHYHSADSGKEKGTQPDTNLGDLGVLGRWVSIDIWLIFMYFWGCVFFGCEDARWPVVNEVANTSYQWLP